MCAPLPFGPVRTHRALDQAIELGALAQRVGESSNSSVAASGSNGTSRGRQRRLDSQFASIRYTRRTDTNTNTNADTSASAGTSTRVGAETTRVPRTSTSTYA